MPKHPVAFDVNCPYCNVVQFELVPTNNRTVLQSRCTNVSCRHRFTIITRDHAVTDGELVVVVYATATDRKKDGLPVDYDVVEAGSLPLVALRDFIWKREHAVNAHVDAVREELDHLKRLLATRERRAQEELVARQRVEAEAARSVSDMGKASKAGEDEGTESLRANIRFIVGKKVEKRKLTAEAGADMLRRIGTMKGLRE